MSLERLCSNSIFYVSCNEAFFAFCCHKFFLSSWILGLSAEGFEECYLFRQNDHDIDDKPSKTYIT